MANNIYNDLLQYRIAITLIPGVGDVVAKKLIAYCGGEEAVFKNKRKALLKVPGVGEKVAEAVLKQNVLSRAEQEIRFLEKHKVTPLFYLDDNYPARLKHCDDSPVMLYIKGKMELNIDRVVAIVGTRSATSYGKTICNRLVDGLAEQGILIVSGLAYGIDICAHKAALKNNMQTVAVVAHGHDRIYPYVHTSTAENMLENGGIVTEFLSGTNPDKENFPRRNRIIAGLCDAVIVIETARRGGSLITAELANSYNRDVFAFPGRVGEGRSDGCNWLIKTNKAALAESAEDVLQALRWDKLKGVGANGNGANQMILFQNLSPEEEALINVLKESGSTPIDLLCLKANMSTSKAGALLMGLEFSGIIKCLPGKVYQIN